MGKIILRVYNIDSRLFAQWSCRFYVAMSTQNSIASCVQSGQVSILLGPGICFEPQHRRTNSKKFGASARLRLKMRWLRWPCPSPSCKCFSRKRPKLGKELLNTLEAPFLCHSIVHRHKKWIETLNGHEQNRQKCPVVCFKTTHTQSYPWILFS